MALSEAILVCLTEGPQSGYDLAKTFQTSIGFFWQSDHQRIYRELKKLHENGFVDVEFVVQEERPNKKIYALTEAGRARLLEWSRERSGPPAIKDDMLVKLYALEHVDIPAMREQIKARKEEHRQRYEFYKKLEAKRFSKFDQSNAKEVGVHLGLQIGLGYDGGWVDWCDQALAALDQVEKAARE